MKRLPLTLLSAFLIVFLYRRTFYFWLEAWISGSYYSSHAPLIPLISGYLIWRKRESLKKEQALRESNIEDRISSIEKSKKRLHFFTSAFSPFALLPSCPLVLLAFALALQIFSIWLDILLLSGLSFVLLLFGIVLLFFGTEFLKLISFPLGFLCFMIPVPLLGYSLGYPLQMKSASLASALVGLLGFDVLREGTILHIQNYTFTVDEPCSGLKSGIALLAIGTLIAYSSRTSPVLKPLLVLFAIPVALFANVFRIVLTMLLSQIISPFFADKFFHYFSGLLFFVAPTALVYAIVCFFERLTLHEEA